MKNINNKKDFSATQETHEYTHAVSCYGLT